MPPSEVERGPCKVAAAGCLGKEPSKNSQHGDGDGKGKHVDWKWRKASKVGSLTATDKRFGGVETSWAINDDVCAACQSLALVAPVRGAKAAKAAAAAASAAAATGAPMATADAAAAPAAAAPAAAAPAAAAPAAAPAAADATAHGATDNGDSADEGAPQTRVEFLEAARAHMREHRGDATGDYKDAQYEEDQLMIHDIHEFLGHRMCAPPPPIDDDASDSSEDEKLAAATRPQFLVRASFEIEHEEAGGVFKDTLWIDEEEVIESLIRVEQCHAMHAARAGMTRDWTNWADDIMNDIIDLYLSNTRARLKDLLAAERKKTESGHAQSMRAARRAWQTEKAAAEAAEAAGAETAAEADAAAVDAVAAGAEGATAAGATAAGATAAGAVAGATAAGVTAAGTTTAGATAAGSPRRSSRGGGSGVPTAADATAADATAAGATAAGAAGATTTGSLHRSPRHSPRAGGSGAPARPPAPAPPPAPARPPAPAPSPARATRAAPAAASGAPAASPSSRRRGGSAGSAETSTAELFGEARVEVSLLSQEPSSAPRRGQKRTRGEGTSGSRVDDASTDEEAMAPANARAAAAAARDPNAWLGEDD